MTSKTNLLEVERTIAAPAAVAWQVIADMEGYADITSEGIARVEVLGGKGQGMLRRCTNDKGQSWTETCPLWTEGREYRFVVDTKAPDYPYPLESLEGHWLVEERPKGTMIKARFEYRLKYGPLGQLMGRLMERGARKDAQILLDKWEARANSLAEQTVGAGERVKQEMSAP